MFAFVGELTGTLSVFLRNRRVSTFTATPAERPAASAPRPAAPRRRRTRKAPGRRRPAAMGAKMRVEYTRAEYLASCFAFKIGGRALGTRRKGVVDSVPSAWSWDAARLASCRIATHQ